MAVREQNQTHNKTLGGLHGRVRHPVVNVLFRFEEV
jgi:hypothetical protein